MYYLIKGETIVGKADVAPNIEDLCRFGVEAVEDDRDLDISMYEYVDGVIQEKVKVEYSPTKTERIEYIKKYYDERFAKLDQALVRRRLVNRDITDLQEQYKQLNIEMLAKIKAVK